MSVDATLVPGQKIIVAEPPNIEAIDKRFHTRGRPIVYAWGEKIYNPAGVVIHPHILRHEAIHGYRQLAGAVQADDSTILTWWERYLEDPAFRLEEEVIAHRGEYDHLVQSAKDRNRRNQLLQHVAAKLAAPLYGHLTTTRHARRLIEGARA